jgi:hypothetical protein
MKQLVKASIDDERTRSDAAHRALKAQVDKVQQQLTANQKHTQSLERKFSELAKH